ncbi:MAG: imidazolonepropionase [Alphaproteobacteria bacterium]|nr:imidazolonepropionase [Alphaproteobacteria bacterium]
MWDAIWINGVVATMEAGAPYGLIDNGAIGIDKGRIAWVGEAARLPAAPTQLARDVVDAKRQVITPGLVDCHTHIVHAGHRRADFELRIAGAGRDDLAKISGGVRGTVLTTRRAPEELIFRESAARISELIANGVTTMESKSGFGLDRDTELRTLRVSRELGRRLPLTVVNTFLGAHGVAPEFDGRADAWIDHLAQDILPAAIREGLVEHCDGFCDKLGFSHEQMGRLFDVATANGIRVKLHADQYNDFGAPRVVAKYHGLSADHCEYSNEETVRIMAEAGVVCTLLPGANYALFETKRPPIDLFRKHGVAMAVATNNNPSSSPGLMPTMMMNLACHLFRVTPEEALAGFTRVGARALGLEKECGTIAAGKAADLAVWDVEHPGELAYRIASSPCRAVVKAGRVVHRASPPDLLRSPG